MNYLLDVDALVGLAIAEHTLHQRIATWVNILNPRRDLLATCAITEIGLVRILSLPFGANLSILEAQATLSRIKATSIAPLVFVPDALGADHLPTWVKHSKETTDGHLFALAKAHGAVLATCDQKIPGAFLIPA